MTEPAIVLPGYPSFMHFNQGIQVLVKGKRNDQTEVDLEDERSSNKFRIEVTLSRKRLR